jgi:hypothetical protein
MACVDLPRAFAATTACALLGANWPTAGLAQVILPPAELRGAGTQDVGEPLVRSWNCVGRPAQGLNPMPVEPAPGLSVGRIVRPGLFAPTIGPLLDCRDGVPVPPPTGGPVITDEIQLNLEGRYVGVQSGFGRRMWREFNDLFAVTARPNLFGVWPNLQFAFSETPLGTADIASYNVNAQPLGAGPPIAVPFFVIPISLAYNPVYGRLATGGPLLFRLKAGFAKVDPLGNPVGGLRLSKSAYCRIMNGEIVNWNDPQLKVLNGNQDLRDLNDPAARWAVEGVPIRLVGRLDRAGTTEVFTRHLAAACGPLVVVNRFAQSADSLPFDPTSAIDMRVYRPDARYFPGTPPADLAGTLQSISGAYYDDVGDFVNNGQGVETPGRFMLANLASGVEEAIRIEGATMIPSFIDPSITLNGKFGYVGADWAAAAPGRTLFSAALQQGSSTVYLVPNSVNATKAFGTGATTLLPPQTTATSGAFDVNDPRVSLFNPALLVSRAQPLDWWQVLYQSPALTLANPPGGYPITGVSQLLSYTCFSTDAKRWGLGNWWADVTAKVLLRWNGLPLDGQSFRGTTAAKYGILTQMNVATVPPTWLTALTETFLKKSTQASPPASEPLLFGAGYSPPLVPGQVVKLATLDPKPSALALVGPGAWIQSKIPTKPTDIDGILSNGESVPNPACVPGLGA